MTAELIGTGYRFDQFIRQFPGFYGTEPYPPDDLLGRYALQQPGECCWRMQIQSIAAHVYARQDNFMITGFRQGGKMSEYLFDRHAAASTTGIRYDTVSAEGVTAILDFKERTAPGITDSHWYLLKYGGLALVVLREQGVGKLISVNQCFRNFVLVIMSDNFIYTIDVSDICGSRLSIASGNNDAGSGVGTNGLANGLTGLHGGFSGDRTGVDDADIRRSLAIDLFPSVLAQTGADRFRFKLIYLASKSRNEKFWFCHDTLHK